MVLSINIGILTAKIAVSIGVSNLSTRRQEYLSDLKQRSNTSVLDFFNIKFRKNQWYFLK